MLLSTVNIELFLFYYPAMNISLRGMIWDHLTDTYVTGDNGHTGIGPRNLKTSEAGFPVRDRYSVHLPQEVSPAPCRVIIIMFWYYDTCIVIDYIFIRIRVTCLQNISLCSRIVRSRLSQYFLFSPVMQCLQCILSAHWDDLFPFMLSKILHLYLNHSLASTSVMSCK